MLTKFTIAEKELFFEDALSSTLGFEVLSHPRPYSVVWEETDSINSINEILAANDRNLLLIDANVFALISDRLKADKKRFFIAEANEDFKTIAGVLKVVDWLSDNKFTKGEKLLAVGGGIIQDVAAFVGAIYKRGINWVYFPTTFLSMCDSCIGGKTAINYRGIKNQLALFSAPSQVVIDANFLFSLERREIRNGLGESLKLAITGGKSAFDLYCRNEEGCLSGEREALKKMIFMTLAVKKAVIEDDEFELNWRRSLNYGHSFGHAIESVSKYGISHGVAVAVGVAMVNQMALNRGLLSLETNDLILKETHKLITAEEKLILNFLELSDVVKTLQADKKTLGNKISFVLIRDFGDTIFLPIAIDDQLFVEATSIWRKLFS